MSKKKETETVEEQPATAEVDQAADETPSLGSISIHNNVIATIARRTTLEVPGVSSLVEETGGGLSGVLSKKMEGGIRISVHDNTVKIGLRVLVDYGVRIPKVAWQIQHNVTEAVEEMTGRDVEAVNVVIQSVSILPEGSEMGDEE